MEAMSEWSNKWTSGSNEVAEMDASSFYPKTLTSLNCDFEGATIEIAELYKEDQDE